MDGIYTPISAKGKGKEQAWPGRLGNLIGSQFLRTMQRFVQDQKAYIARCKRACILHDWISGVPLNEIEQTYSINRMFAAVSYGDITNIANTTRFHLRSAIQIVSLLIPDPLKFNEEVDALLNQLEVGIPKAAIPLIGIPGIRRGDILALYKAGITSPNDLKGLSELELLEMLGPDASGRIHGFI